MNIEILAHALRSLVEAHKTLDTVSMIGTIGSHATSGVSNATSQERFVETKNELLSALHNFNEINLFDYEVEILEMANLRFLLPTEVARRIISSVTQNEATLAVIGTEISALGSKLEEAIEACSTLLESLKEINIIPYEIEEGNAAVAVQFPISLYKNDLKSLGKEFVKTESILSELIKYSTGETADFSIEALSNEAATVVIGLALAAADRVSLILERLSKAFLNVQEGRLKAQELRERKAGSKNIQDRRNSLADEQEKLSNDELLEEIKLIASELNKSQIKNSQLGFEKALKKLIEQKVDGVEYDVLAIPYEDADENSDSEIEPQNELIRKINSREGRELVKLFKDVDLKLIEHLGANEADEESEDD